MPTPNEQQTAGHSAVSARTQLIDAARTGWINRLIDLSRRNNLLYYRSVPSGSIDVLAVNPALHLLLMGKMVSAQSLLADPQERVGRVLSIARKAMENSEEKGLQTLYLAVGFATWTSEDGGRDANAPFFLLPLQMRKKGKDLSAIEIQVAGDPQINPVLLHILADQFNIILNEDGLLEAVDPGDTKVEAEVDTNGSGLLKKFGDAVLSVEAQTSKIPGFKTSFSAAISNFSFAKLALVNDLKEAGARLNSNDVIAAIAGDNEARGRLGSSQVEVNPRTLDEKRPDQEFCVVEADSSQQCAIAGIAAGQNAVVHGPPGTGKSQTITNLIATLVAEGKKVLFVAEKRAALEVVQQRLEKCGLDHLAMDLHGAELSSRKIMERITKTLNTVRNARPPQVEIVHQQFEDRRTKLNAHDTRMHIVSERCGKSVFDIQGALLRLPKGAVTSVRWRGPDLVQITPRKARLVHDLLREAAPFEALFTREDSSPWTGVSFRTGQEVQNAIDSAQKLMHETLPYLQTKLDNLQKLTGFQKPENLAEVDAAVEHLTAVNRWLEKYEVAVFSADIPAMLRVLARAKNGGLKAWWVAWRDTEVKATRAKVIALRKDTEASIPVLYTELSALQEVSLQWQSASSGSSIPFEYADLVSLQKASANVCMETQAFQKIVAKSGWDKLSLEEITAHIAPYTADSTTPYRLLSLSELERNLEASGVQRLVDDLRQRKPQPSLWGQTFEYAWLNSALDEMAIQNPAVKAFIGTTHDSYVEEFKKLDSDRLKVAKDRIRRLHAERTIAAMNAHPDQEAMIKQEAAKTRRFKPLRKVFQEGCEVMTAVCPCWMASPLSVAQLIHPDVKFDYVIFDEASQILPEDAIPSIMRGKYVIVAGDNKQLPPTGFFASGIEDDDTEMASAGFESLLDMMLPFARSFHLNWHYRSRDEALIAFSNHWMYDDKLVTFPGVGGTAAMRHVLVHHIPDSDGQEDSSSAEVRRVVELVLQHAQEKPNKSLGVISMGIKHAMKVQSALDVAQSKHPELAEFFDPGRSDRFFVKNLERVQGDERDCIILTVGYGKDRAGNLPLRFGPILSAGGMRRLNVAVTRARESMTVVSSFAHTDIDTTKVKPKTGLEFLRNYLQYAASEGKIFSHGEMTDEPMNDFEADIHEALTSRGLKLTPQVGCSSFRIDFGVCHPTEPGRFVLAIEADGATYHSSFTARDRDRLRQQMLENLGWTFHRIWSTDWFQRRHEEIDRTVLAYEQAVAKSNERKLASPPVHIPAEIIPDVPLEELSVQRSSTFPPIPKRASISDYTSSEMRALYEWVCSDGKLRTHDEISDEMFSALPFARRGSKIEAALAETIRRCERVSQ